MPERPQKPADRPANPRKRTKGHGAAKEEMNITAFAENLLRGMKGGVPFAQPGLDDRAIAMIAGAFLEEWLKCAMLIRFRRTPTQEEDNLVFRSNGGALSTFANRINICALMGLLTKADRHDLAIIKGIRNDFAHSFVHRSFDDADIAAKCAKLCQGVVYKGEIAGVARRRFIESAARAFFNLTGATLKAMVETTYLTQYKDEITEAADAMFTEWSAKAGIGADA